MLWSMLTYMLHAQFINLLHHTHTHTHTHVSLPSHLTSFRIIVSAPKATVPGGNSEPITGAVYECPVNVGTCSGLPGKLFDTSRE